MRIVSIAVSKKKGTRKIQVSRANLLKDYGLEGDAHAGPWHRQVSLLADEDAETIRDKGVDIRPGDFGENILTTGLDISALQVGASVRIGDAVLQVTQIGKTCHSHCAIYDAAGTCVMPTNGVFCRVIETGVVQPGDSIHILN